MSFDLTNKNISDTFQNLLQRTGSDNRLYDLTGNQVTNLRINGTLTADQYVVSSSVTNVITIAQSGSTIFGNSIDDTHQFTGNITSSGHFIGQLPPDGGDNVLRYLKTSGDASSVKIEMGDLTGDAGGGTTLVLDDDAAKVDITGNLLVSGILSSSGDLTSRAGTIERGFIINSDGGAHATVIRGLNDDNLFLANTNPSGVDKIAIGTTSFLSKLTIDGDLTTTSHITASNNISASGTIFADSGSFNYITASIIDVNSDTIRFGGETFKKSDVQKLKQGKTLKDAGVGRAHGDLIAHDGAFDGNITASGVVSASGGFVGDGSQLTGLTSAAISSYTNNGNNRIVTSVNSSTVNGEANLTFDGTSLNVNGELTSSKVLVNAPNPTDDFFLLKSGSLDSLKVNNQGVLILGGFTYTPTAVRGGLYYDQDDDEFYAGKNN